MGGNCEFQNLNNSWFIHKDFLRENMLMWGLAKFVLLRLAFRVLISLCPVSSSAVCPVLRVINSVRDTAPPQRISSVSWGDPAGVPVQEGQRRSRLSRCLGEQGWCHDIGEGQAGQHQGPLPLWGHPGSYEGWGVFHPEGNVTCPRSLGPWVAPNSGCLLLLLS